MKDFLLGAAAILITSAIGALVLWAMWHWATFLAPFVRAFTHSL